MIKTKKKEQSFSKFGFIISAFGSSIGLGSIWRFPTMMAQSGGGAFLIPFVISMLICGIPILMFEMNVGNKFKSVQVEIFDRLYGKKGRFFGYFYPTIAFLIAAFYVVVLGWVLLQLVISFTNNLFVDNFLFGELLKTPDNLKSLSDIGKPSWWLILALIFIFCLVAIISLKGIKKGVEKLNKILIPLLFIILLSLMIYCLTLDGAAIGLDKMWKPDWAQLGETKVWTNAFSQSFFSISIAMGTIMYFSSKTKKAQDNNNAAFVVCLPLVLISIIAGMMNFSALGFLAKSQNCTIEHLIGPESDPSLIFRIFPQIFKQIGLQTHNIFGQILAICFYLCLFFAGFMTLIALTEVVSGNILSKSKLSHKKNTLLWIFLIFCTSLVYTVGGGKFLIDGVDIWVNNIWLFVMAIVELYLIIIIIKSRKIKLKPLWNEILQTSNANSWIKIGKKYTIVLIFNMALLSILIAFNLSHLAKILQKPHALVAHVYFGIPMGFGLQILMPLILTTKEKWRWKTNKKTYETQEIISSESDQGAR